MGFNIDCSRKIIGIYKVHEILGKGAFAEVYRVTDLIGTNLAAKFVSEIFSYLLEHESKVMNMAGRPRQHGVPYWYYFGQHGKHFVLVMDLFGPSLRNIKYRYGRLSLKSALLLGIQMTSRLEALHDRGFIHCDIKPDNVVVGKHEKERKCLYLIDYGASVQITSGKATKHGPVSRKRDLGSAIGMTIYLLQGLRWREICSAFLSGADHIKKSASAMKLWAGLPKGIKSYYCYVTNLGHEERPDYEMLRGYLQTALNRYELEAEGDFEWTRPG